jgi:hypothetical protein
MVSQILAFKKANGILNTTTTTKTTTKTTTTTTTTATTTQNNNKMDIRAALALLARG